MPLRSVARARPRPGGLVFHDPDVRERTAERVHARARPGAPLATGAFPRAALAAAAMALCGAALAAGKDTAPPPAPAPPVNDAGFAGPGFAGSSRETQRRTEATLLAVPDPQKARAYLAALTEEPRVAGTPGGERGALWMQERLREWGLETSIVPYEVLLNLPETVSLRMTVPEVRDLSLRETGYGRDKDSFSPEVLPAFHGYGASGRAAGQIVYANYGRPEDFDTLDGLGLSVRGRIALIRYGEVFRGLKVSEAQKRGAAGVILYSDPADDGYARGDVYPDGPWRPETAIQRGSVQFLSLGPGDPQTPGRPSRKDAVRIPREKLETIPKIPSLPISYGEAAPLLRALAGPGAPAGWQGALPFAYHLGPGPAEVEMNVEMDYGVRTIRNVVTKIPGAVEPDLWIVLGSHRDAWAYGAVDPNSADVALLEAARALSGAVKAGWKPKRTIVLAFWDGEEYGLLGSTEWVEDLAGDLGARGVAYVNMDSAVSGQEFGMGGSPSLREFLVSVADALPDPRRGRSLGALWREKRLNEWAERPPDTEPFEAHLDWLGSGSDYTAFLDHLGIASADVRFSGPYGVYHSIFDSFFWMERFGDPGFLTHAAAARFAGITAARLASADTLPFRFTPLASAIGAHLRELEQLGARRARRATAAGKPAPAPSGAVPAELSQALETFRAAAQACDRALDALDAATDPLPAERAARLNAALAQVERAFLDPEGLPGRPWFRHLLYAPGLTTGYAAWPLPGLRGAFEASDTAAFEREAGRLARRIRDASARLEEIRRIASAGTATTTPG